jgi:hypothetical protein
LVRRLGDPRAGLDCVEKRKFLTLPGLFNSDSYIVEPVANLYTDRAIPAPHFETLKEQ